MNDIEINEVYTFKLSSGEELVGKVLEVSENILTLSHPLSVAPSHQGMGLRPSMFTAEPE